MYQEKDKRISPKFSALKMGWNFVQKGERKFYAASAQKSGVSLSGSILCNACHQSIWS
jgi:hypothetical protein